VALFLRRRSLLVLHLERREKELGFKISKETRETAAAFEAGYSQAEEEGSPEEDSHPAGEGSRPEEEDSNCNAKRKSIVS